MTKKKSTNKTLKVATSAALLASSFSTIVAPMSASASFPDIAGNYHEKDILQLLERKIIQGYPDGTFKPANSITRGQAAKMIASVLNLDTKNITNPGFSDVDEKHEFYPYIAALAKEGIINGYEDGTFKQDATITRGQMAKMIALGFNLTSEKKHPFTDVAEGSIYTPYIKALFNYEVTTGTTDTTFSPRNNVSRGQLASFVIRAENAAKAPVNGSVEGTIEEVLANAIIIDGKTVTVSADFSKALTANKQAFEGAKIALNTKDSEATNITKLELATNATSFDGNGLPIQTLSIPASVEMLENVTAETIHYHVTDQPLTANNVKVRDFYLNNEKIVLASIANVNLPSNVTNITFNSSTIENIHSNVDEVTISKTNTTIKNIFAKNTQQLTLNGDFANVTISPNTNINGTAKIEILIFDQQPNKYVIAVGIAVSKVSYNNQTYTWNDFVAKFPTQQEGSSETTTEDSATVTPDQNGSTAGTGSTGGTSNGTGSTTGGGSNSSGESNTGSGSTDSTDTGSTDKPAQGNETSETKPNTPEPKPEKPAAELIIIDENSNKVTVGNASFDVTDDQKAFLASQKENIKDITLATTETGETVIQKIIVDTNQFDGSTLNNVPVNNLIVTAQTISNITNVDTLTIKNTAPTTIQNVDATTIIAEGNIDAITGSVANTITVNTTASSLNIDGTEGKITASGPIQSIRGTAVGSLAIDSTANDLTINAVIDSVDLGNTKANVQLFGEVAEITGGAAGILTIAPTNASVNVANVGADEIIVDQALPSPIAMASLPMMRTLFANTASNFEIKFTGDDYKDKTLTIKREDTIVDVQSSVPFSKVNVEGNGTLINSNTKLAEISVAAGVTFITLNADVGDFTFTLSAPVQISSPSARTITNLNMKTNTTESIKGWVSLIQIQIAPGNISLNNSSIDLSHEIFQQDAPEASYPAFSSSLQETTNLMKYGQYKVILPAGLSDNIWIAQLTEGESVTEYLKKATLPANAKSYDTSSTFFLEALTKNIVIYKTDASEAIQQVSTIATDTIAPFLLSVNKTDGLLTLYTRYSTAKPLQDQMKYLYIFKDGKLRFEKTDFSDITIDTSTGPHLVKIPTNLKGVFSDKGEAFISDNYMVIRGDVQPYYSQMLTLLADKAYKAREPERVRDLLTYVSQKNGATFDSLFLSEYVKAIANNQSKYLNDLNALLDLIEELTPQYQLDIQLSADDLYLPSAPVANTASYSVSNIVKVETAPTAGKLLFTPLAEGTTTVRIADKDGAASLINIKVTKDANGKLVIPANDPTNNVYGYQVIANAAESGTLLDGTNNFRFFTNAQGTFLLPTKLEESFALVKLANNSLNGYAAANGANGYTLSVKREIEPVEVTLAELGLTNLTNPNSVKIGFLENDSQDGYILYPRATTTEIVNVTDGAKTTAINISATETKVTPTIAKSPNTLNITSNLKLDAITNTTLYPQDSLDIHYTKDGDDIQFYTNKAAKVAYVFSDSANNKTIVNVTSSTANNQLSVANGEIVNHDLSTIAMNNGATVTNISGTSVRAHGLEIFATQTGTSIVTLSNGKQYQFDVKQSSNQFTITAEEVQNVVIDAQTLHMTNIKEATSSNASDRLQVVDGKLVVNLAANGTSTITVKSDTSPAETTVLYVTKTDAGYEFDPATDIVRAELDAADLGLATVTKSFGDATPTARIKVVDGKAYVYGFTEGTRLFRVNDGTNNTAINVTVSKGADDKLTVNAVPITHVLTTPANGTIASNAVRAVGNLLYATGLGFEAATKVTIEVPVASTSPDVEAFYTIGLAQDTDSKLLSFDATATTTLKTFINKADFDFGTLYDPTVTAIAPGTGDHISTAVSGDRLLITATANDEARIQVNESSASDAKAYVYIKRDGNSLTAKVEKSTTTDLNDYGYTTTPTTSFSKTGVVRAHVDANLNVDFYALAEGKTAYKVEDGNGKNLFVNVEVAGANERTVTPTVVMETLTGKATIIEGDAVRLSSNSETLYANKVGTTSIVKLADGSFIQYEVVENSDGQYELAPTPIAKSAMISKTDLGLTGTLEVSGLNATIASYSLTNDGIIIYGNANGTTSMTVKGDSKTVVVNVTIEDTGVTITQPISTTTTVEPKLIHAEDANIVRIDGKTVYALAPGQVEVLVGNTVQQITVTKQNDQYAISDPVHISNAVYSATDLGFATNAAMTIETGYNTSDFSVKNVDGKIVAYSKLAAGATGSTEFIVNASSERTLVNLKDTGIDLITATIAKQAAAINTAATINDQTIARQKDGTIYALKEGSTHATVTGYIQAVDVTRVGGLLSATVTPLVIEGPFTALTETDLTLIGIESGDIYAKKTEGKTVVQDTSGQVFEIIITNTNGKVTIDKKAISSKALLASAAQLANIETATVLYGNNNAVTLSILDKNDTKNGVAIYSNATTAQNVAVLVTDKNGDKAIIEVTIDETGKITKADYVKETTPVVLPTAPKEIVQTTNARGVWDDTTLTTYAIGTGNAALKFANGLVNVVTTKDDTNKVTMSTEVLKHTGFTAALNSITNGAMLKTTANGFYPINTGSALVHADGKVYSVNVTLENGLYDLTVSDGVAFTDLAIGATDTFNATALKGVSVARDSDDNKLIIYKDGATTGTSDIVITSGTDKTVYHVKADASTVQTPVESKGTIDASMTTDSTIIGDSIRLDGTNIYYLAEKASTIKLENGRLVTVDVTRDENGYFKATPKYVSGTVTAAPATLTNYAIDGTTIYAKPTDIANLANTTETALIDDPTDATKVKAYYTTFSTKRTDDKFDIEIDERKAYQYNPATDFGLGADIVEQNNTLDTVASAKIVDGKLVVIAGTVAGSTDITVADKNGKQLVIKATLGTDGKFNVYPQASLNSLLFADIGLDNSAETITAENYKSDVISVTVTKTGLNITAKKPGSTSLQLKRDNAVIGLVNIIVEDVGGYYQATSTPVVFETTLNALELDNANDQKAILSTRKDSNKYYATSVGEALHGDGSNAQFVRVTQTEEKGLYHISSTKHAMKTIPVTDLGLGNLNTAVSATAAVGTLISKDLQNLYVYGQNTGTTDIPVSDGTSTALVVAINGSTLSTHVAREQLTQLATEKWTSNAPTIATVRNGYIYAQETGSTVLETTLNKSTANEYKALMNVNVSRNENRTFNITPEVVAATNTGWTAVEVLTGADAVVADSTTLYAQQAGTATVKVTAGTSTKVYTVTVSQNANGTYKMTLSQPMTHVEYTAAELGLDSLSTPVVNSINGAGVVTAQITDGKLIVLAKTSGQAEVTVNDGQTTIHFLVTEEAGELKVIPTIAKTTIIGATSIVKSEGDNGIVRFVSSDIYALKIGKIIANVDGELYNINVAKEENKFTPSADRIEYDFIGAATINVTDGSALKVDGSKIVAVDFKSEIVTVDGKTYKVTVNKDGTLDVVLFAANSFNFADSALATTFTAIDSASSISGLTTAEITGSTVTIKPNEAKQEAGTDIVTVVQNGNTVQLKATVTATADGFEVSTIELVSKTLNAGDLNGVYAQSVFNTDGSTTFSSAKGILTTSNGQLTVYPGVAGEVHFIVRDSEGKQSFFALNSDSTNTVNSFTVKPVTQRITNNAFGYNPVVLATNGKAAATVDGEALNVTFADTNETVFVTTSDNNLYHTVLTKASVNGDIFELADAVIQPASVIEGDITDVTEGLHAVTHNGKTILYATLNTPQTAYFKDQVGVMNKVTVNQNNYALTVKRLIADNSPSYSNIQFMNGTGEDVVVDVNGQLAIKKAGTGIYKVDNTNYVEITVSDAPNYTVSFKELAKADLSTLGTAVTVLAPTTGVYMDGLTIYGDTTEKVAVSVTNGANTKIYTAKETTTQAAFDNLQPLELDLLDVLGWTSFESHTLVENSQFALIDKASSKLIPKTTNPNGEVITFTTASGIQKQVTVKVTNSFEFEHEVGLDQFNFTTTSFESSMGSQLNLTFSMNITGTDFQVLTEVDGTPASPNTELIFMAGFNNEVTETYRIKTPETAPTVWHTFTVHYFKDNDIWQIPNITSNTASFNFK